MNPAQPTTRSAIVSAVDSTAREMPKSMTRGPSGEQHVGRLEVAVHHARSVDRAQAFRQARGQGQHDPAGSGP